MSQRSVLVTVALLAREGIPASADMEGERVRVTLGDRSTPGACESKAFDGRDLGSAANWLLSRVVRHYPSCSLTNVWRSIAEAAIALETGYRGEKPDPLDV